MKGALKRELLYTWPVATDTDCVSVKEEGVNQCETLSSTMTLILSDKRAVKSLRILTLEACTYSKGELKHRANAELM